MKIRFLGHSALELTVGSTVILVDPFITGNPLAEPVVKVEDLQADCILLTHAHGDHWGDTPAIAARTNAVVVANFEIVTYLAANHDYHNSIGMNIGGSWTFDWGSVTQTDARHSSSFPDGTYGGSPNGYLIRSEGKTVYILGDTSPIAEMQWIGNENKVDVAFVPIGDCFTMGLKGAAKAVEMIRPALSIPVHFDTFPPIEVDAEAWISDLNRVGYKGQIMSPGETITV